jgi:hypothetical protein
MTIIGIDPGATGGIAVVRDGMLVHACSIPYLKQPIERVWLDGGVHKSRFMAGIINDSLLHTVFSRWVGLDVVVYIEEPPAKFGGEHGELAGTDASINRAFQGICQVANDLLHCPIYTAAANHWPRFVFRNVPREWQGGDFALRQAKAKSPITAPDKKDRARLACVMEWGYEATACMRKTKSSQIDSGMADAACLALFGMLHQKQTPRLFTQSMRMLMSEAGVG